MSISIDKNLSGRENLLALVQHTWPDHADLLTEDNIIFTPGPVTDKDTSTLSVTITGTGGDVIGHKEVTYTVTNLSKFIFPNEEVTTSAEMSALVDQFITENVDVPEEELEVGEITWKGDTWNASLSAKEGALVTVGSLEMVAYHTLQPLLMNIFNDAGELADAIANLRPVTQKEIFDTWPRFDVPMGSGAQSYWEDPSQATGDTMAWQYQEATGRVVQPLNTTSWTGFVSKTKYDRYDHSVTIGSTGNDDDFNGIVLAHTFQNGVNNLLLLALSPNPGNGAAWAGAENSSNIIVLRSGDLLNPFNDANDFTVITNPLDPKSPGNWNVKGERRVSAARRGDNFTIKLSTWNSAVVTDNFDIEFNLNDHPDLAIFKGPQAYGYFSLSQPNSYFKDIFFDGGERPDTILFAPTQEIYEYVPGEGWKVDVSKNPLTLYGAPRELRNSGDGKRYILDEDGLISPVE